MSEHWEAAVEAGARAGNKTLARFWSKVDTSGSCWLWLAHINPDGYGTFWDAKAGRTKGAHRYSYEVFTGPIPDGLHLDHLCRNRSCVNPAHLQPVSLKENVLRGVGRTAQNHVKTHCDNGHPLSGANLAIRGARKFRRCRTCENEAARRYRRKLAAQEATDVT